MEAVLVFTNSYVNGVTIGGVDFKHWVPYNEVGFIIFGNHTIECTKEGNYIHYVDNIGNPLPDYAKYVFRALKALEGVSLSCVVEDRVTITWDGNKFTSKYEDMNEIMNHYIHDGETSSANIVYSGGITFTINADYITIIEGNQQGFAHMIEGDSTIHSRVGVLQRKGDKYYLHKGSGRRHRIRCDMMYILRFCEELRSIGKAANGEYDIYRSVFRATTSRKLEDMVDDINGKLLLGNHKKSARSAI
jgi:hypothetical protein